MCIIQPARVGVDRVHAPERRRCWMISLTLR